MKKYEYMVIHTYDDFAECLNDYGIDGWDLVSVVYTYRFILYLKKEIE